MDSEPDFAQKYCRVVSPRPVGPRGGHSYTTCEVRVSHQDLTVVASGRRLIETPAGRVEIITSNGAVRRGTGTAVRVHGEDWRIHFYDSATAEMTVAGGGGFKLIIGTVLGFGFSRLTKRSREMNDLFLDALLKNGAVDRRKHPRS